MVIVIINGAGARGGHENAVGSAIGLGRRESHLRVGEESRWWYVLI
jgi:hypothetical protein